MRIVVLFGTESGVSEMVAEDLAGELDGHEVEVRDMSDPSAVRLDPDALHLIVCSTYGEGELPSGAVPFHAALASSRPDLAGVDYAMLGLGDSSYEHSYSRGSEIIDRTLAGLGARRVGDYGRHDAAVDGDPSAIAVSWAMGVLASALAARS